MENHFPDEHHPRYCLDVDPHSGKESVKKEKRPLTGVHDVFRLSFLTPQERSRWHRRTLFLRGAFWFAAIRMEREAVLEVIRILRKEPELYKGSF